MQLHAAVHGARRTFGNDPAARERGQALPERVPEGHLRSAEHLRRRPHPASHEACGRARERRVRGHQLGRGLPNDCRELQGHSGQVWQGGAVDPVLHGGLPALPTTFGQRARRSGRWLERLRHGSGQWPDHGVLALDRHVRAEYYVGVARGQRGHFSQHQSGGNESHLVARHA